MSVRFDVEWLDAPGVMDEVLAATWGRLGLSIRVPDSEEFILTRALDRSGGSRTGTYGAWFPLARWLVTHYWNLLYEAPLGARTLPGRECVANEAHRAWAQRHNLLAAREGFSLPDCAFVSDGDFVKIAVFPDQGAEKRTRRPVSFVSSGSMRVPRFELRESIASFVEATLKRLAEVAHDDVTALRDDWQAIIQSPQEEQALCEWAARLGLDPYDPDELSDELADFLERKVAPLAPPIRTDILNAVRRPKLEDAVRWLHARLPLERGLTGALAPQPEVRYQPAHQLGYARARTLRCDLALEQGNVPFEVEKRLGFGIGDEHLVDDAPPTIDAALISKDGRPVLLGAECDHDRRVFRWARGLYMWHFGYAAKSPRLITRAHGRVQRESRAFAAEFLAPHSLLSKRISAAEVDDSDIATLAGEFGVGEQVIRHQVANHRLAHIAE